ncbi:MAG: hypothetical protein ABW321_04910 [Polyangiales bacterium]
MSTFSIRPGFLQSVATAVLLGTLAVTSAVRAQPQVAACVSAHAEAQVLRNRGALLSARKQLLQCARQECPKLVADDCATWLTALDESLSSIVFAVSDDRGRDLVAVTVTANGETLTERADGRALPLDPGVYALRFSAEGYLPAELSVSVRQSEKNRIVRVQLAAEGGSPSEIAAKTPASPAATDASPHPIPVISYVLGGTLLVGAGMYAYFGLSGLSKENELEKLPPDTACGSLCSAGRRDYILADIGLGVAVGSAIGAVAAFLLYDPRADAPARTQLRISPLAAQRGVLVHWSGSF